MKRLPSTLAALMPRLKARDRRNLWILVGVVFLAYAPSLGAALHGGWPFADDAPALIGPWREFARDSLRQGVLPLWNPHLFCGLPFMANGQTAVLYPPNFVYWLFPLHPALWLDALTHNILFASGGYFLARQMRLSRTASMLAALCFALGGSISAHIFTGHMTWHAARAWLPWQGWALLRYGQRGEAKYVVWLALLFALQVAAGYPPLVLMGAAWCLGLFLSRGVSRWMAQRDQSTSRAIWPRHWWLHACSFVMLTALLSAVWILPLRESSALSVHGSGLPYEEAARLSGSWKSVVRLVLPNFFNGNRDMQWSLVFGAHEEAASIGLLPLLLACFAPLLVRHSRHPAMPWLWLVMWPIVLLVLGDNTPLYRWLFDNVAPFRLLRNPVRWLEVWFFVATLLAACTFDVIFKHGAMQSTLHGVKNFATTFLFRACAFVAMLCIVLAGWLWMVPADHEFWLETVRNHPRGRDARDPAGVARVFWNAALSQTLGTLALSLALLWVLRVSRHFSPPSPKRLPLWLVAVTSVELLALFWSCAKVPSAPHTARWVTWPKPLVARYRPGRRWDTGTDWRALNQALPLRIDLFNGYDAMNTKAYFAFVRALEGKDLWSDMYQPHWRTSLLRVAGVTHSLTSIRALDANRTVPGSVTRKSTADSWVPQLAAQDKQWKLWRHHGAWPRVYGTRRLVRAPRPQQLALLEIISREPKFSATVVVAPDTFRNVTAETSEIKLFDVARATNELTMRCEASGRGVVVIGDAWSPGWRAWVNGHEVPIEHANFLFRAVEVPRGEAKVTMVYAPQSFRIGAFLSLCGLAFVVAFATIKVLSSASQMKMREENSGVPLASTRTR